jgi:transposase
MRLIGCDLHASQQSIAMLDRDTGVVVEKTLQHDGEAVREFYASIPPPVVVGIENPGVGSVTALATEVFVGDPARFLDGKALASYVGMIPSEYSSGKRQRLGALTKQGNPFLRFLRCEAAAHAVPRDPDLQRIHRRKVAQKGFAKANVAAARKLGIRLWIMLRDQIDYAEFCRRGLARQS